MTHHKAIRIKLDKKDLKAKTDVDITTHHFVLCFLYHLIVSVILFAVSRGVTLSAD